MLLFMSTFFVVYGGMNWLFYRLLTTSWRPRRLRVPLAFFLTLMVLSPPLVRILENQGWEWVAWLLAEVGYRWMGFLFLFLVFSLLLSLLWLPLWRISRRARLSLPGERGGDYHRFTAPGALFKVALVLSLGAWVYGSYEATDVRLEELTISSPKLEAMTFSNPALFEGELNRPLRLVLISDLHLGLIVREKRLVPILEAVRRAKPDLLLAVGDIVDGQGDGIAVLARELSRIEAPLGKYAVLGNHEYYVGAQDSVEFLEAAGFKVLQGEEVAIGNRLRLAGVDDAAGIARGVVPADQEALLLQRLPHDTFNILLKHQPKIESSDRVDLQLSGHVHGGQIFPFNFVVWLVHRVPTGLSRMPDGRHLYVSRGAGTWGPPIRFLAPPEVTLIHLKQPS